MPKYEREEFDKQYTVRMPKRIYEELERVAAEEFTSPAELIRRSCVSYLTLAKRVQKLELLIDRLAVALNLDEEKLWR